SALRVKKAWSLAGEEQSEMTVQVDEVRYNQDGAPQTVVGKVVEENDKQLVVQVKGTPFVVPRMDVMYRRPVEVPVSQVFTPDEFYNVWLQKIAPGDDADKHVTLAADLVKARDYVHALEHLNKAKELGTARDPARLEDLRKKVELYQANKKERDVLDQ